MARLQTIVYVALITLFRAEASAIDGGFQILENRSPYYGGFSLDLDLASDCPSGTFSCLYSAAGQEGGPCCPTHTVCFEDTLFCCPTEEDCSDAVGNAPTCADPSWTLLSYGDDFLCCPEGMIADSTGTECSTTGGPAPNTFYTSQTQANNASPTGTATSGATAVASSALGSAAGSASASNTSAGAAETSSATTSMPTSVQSSSSTTAGTIASPTKKSSADKAYAASGGLACVMAIVHLL